ncbi:MAG: hypothetical protein ACYC35_16505 [Pirellulales bacterium]
MGKKRKPSPAESPIGLRRVEKNAFELVHPRDVHDRKEDLDEVHAMLEAGEIDVAIDELRWLLSGCGHLLEAHRLLGEIALAENDLELARGHFGRAFNLGLDAMPKGGLAGTLPYRRPANQAFLEAGKGLAYCLSQLGRPAEAAELVRQLLAFDPSDPLAVAKLV